MSEPHELYKYGHTLESERALREQADTEYTPILTPVSDPCAEIAERLNELQSELAEVRRVAKLDYEEAERTARLNTKVEAERDELQSKLDALHSFAGVRTLLQSILDEAYPPNTVVCSERADADIGAQLTMAARKLLDTQAGLQKELDAANEDVLEAQYYARQALAQRDAAKAIAEQNGEAAIAMSFAVKPMWTCPECAFSFDTKHEDEGGGYSCPLCGERKAQAEAKRLREALIKAAPRSGDRGDDGHCQGCDESSQNEDRYDIHHKPDCFIGDALAQAVTP